MAQEIISQTPINTADLHAEMNRIKKRDETLGFRAQKTLDYLESLGTLDAKKSKEMYEKLEALGVPRLRDIHFHKVIDTMPTTHKDVKVCLQGYNVTVTQENCKKIADTVCDFL